MSVGYTLTSNRQIFIPINSFWFMSENKIYTPGAFGGLMRYDSEYASKFMVTPTQVIGGIIVLIIFVLALKFLFPVTAV